MTRGVLVNQRMSQYLQLVFWSLASQKIPVPFLNVGQPPQVPGQVNYAAAIVAAMQQQQQVCLFCLIFWNSRLHKSANLTF